MSCPSSFQGRGASTGYDNAVALPAASDAEEYLKENVKNIQALKGTAVFSIAKCVPWTAARGALQWPAHLIRTADLPCDRQGCRAAIALRNGRLTLASTGSRRVSESGVALPGSIRHT